jgi:RimJ/RimL family protein N-acetyltransferase
MNTVVVKAPAECSTVELDAFRALVCRSGEVAGQGLLQRVRSAKLLAFAFEEGEVIGVAALKIPNPAYRCRIFQCAKMDVDPEDASYELGWGFVCQEHRRKGLSRELVGALLTSSEGRVFATSRASNEAMHKTLTHFGFSEAGERYHSKEHPDETLALFLFGCPDNT